MISKKIIDVIKWKILTIFYCIKVHKWNLHTGFYADYLFWLLLLVITLRPDNNLMEMNKSRTKFVLFITKQQCLKRMILWFWLLDQCKSVDMWIVEKSGQKTRLDLAWSCLYWILDKCHLWWQQRGRTTSHTTAPHPDNLHTPAIKHKILNWWSCWPLLLFVVSFQCISLYFFISSFQNCFSCKSILELMYNILNLFAL